MRENTIFSLSAKDLSAYSSGWHSIADLSSSLKNPSSWDARDSENARTLVVKSYLMERVLNTADPTEHILPSQTITFRIVRLSVKYTWTPASISSLDAERLFHAWYQCLPLRGMIRCTSAPENTASLMLLYSTSLGTRYSKVM